MSRETTIVPLTSFKYSPFVLTFHSFSVSTNRLDLRLQYSLQLLSSSSSSSHPWLLILWHHDHDLPLHDHFIFDRASHCDEGERHLDLLHHGFSQNLLPDVQRRRKPDLLVQEDTAAPRHLGPQNGRDQSVYQYAVDDGSFERRGLGIGRIQVNGVYVPGELGEDRHVPGAEGLGERGPLPDMEVTWLG